MDFRRWFVAWLPLIGYAALVFFLSSQSSVPKFMPNFYLSDKLMHGIEYAIFGGLALHAFQDAPKSPSIPKKTVVLSFLLVALYAISDESHQYFVPHRDASFYDFLADLVGGGVGIWFMITLKRRVGFLNASASRRSPND